MAALRVTSVRRRTRRVAWGRSRWWLGALLLIAAVGASRCGVLGSSGDPSSAGFNDSCPFWSSDSRWIAFDRGPGGVALAERNSDVYVAAADGRRLLRLTRTRAEDEVLGWLEQPSEVVYRNRAGVFAIALRKGAKRHRLGSLRPDDEVVALSHDGRRAFVVQGLRSPPGSDLLAVQDRYAQVVVDFARRTRNELAQGDLGDAYAAWSPDNTSLAFARDRNAFPYSELVVVRGDRVVLRKRLVSLSGLAWSPDGRHLAYGAEVVGGSIDGGAQIWLLRLGDNGARQLTHRTGAENGNPIWSRDGKQIYYQSSGGFRSITPAGTNDRRTRRRTAPTARIADEVGPCPALSPDNTRIAFTRTESAGYFTVAYSLLMVMRADGSDKQPVTADASP